MSERTDSNRRPSRWQRDALPAELLSQYFIKKKDANIKTTIWNRSEKRDEGGGEFRILEKGKNRGFITYEELGKSLGKRGGSFENTERAFLIIADNKITLVEKKSEY